MSYVCPLLVVMADPKQPQNKKMKMTENGDSVIDKFCDPAHPKVIQFEDISAAAIRNKDNIQRTPCTVSIALTFRISLVLHFSDDNIKIIMIIIIIIKYKKTRPF